MISAAVIPAEFSRLYRGRSSPLNPEAFRVLDVRSTLQDRVNQVLRETGLKPAGLARIAEVTKANVTHWTNGTAKTMSGAKAHKIEKKLGYRVQWLIDGDEPPKLGGDSPAVVSADIERVTDVMRNLPPRPRRELLEHAERLADTAREYQEHYAAEPAHAAETPAQPYLAAHTTTELRDAASGKLIHAKPRVKRTRRRA
jgi:predicted XRE-type DNA-binding protein